MQLDGATEISAFLGKGSRVTGKLAFDGPGRIEGQVEGEVSAQDSLVIGERAVVNARIAGASIIVHGNATGDIVARTRLELRAPSRVVGNIKSPSLVIQEGAALEGQCSMGGRESVTVDKDRKQPTLLNGEQRPKAASGATPTP
jgi:cytoskeletal protein CcmA (bactofilin family)